MPRGVTKKWDAHPDWMGHYGFATTRDPSASTKWFSAPPAQFDGGHVQFFTDRRWGATRLFFTEFTWVNRRLEWGPEMESRNEVEDEGEVEEARTEFTPGHRRGHSWGMYSALSEGTATEVAPWDFGSRPHSGASSLVGSHRAEIESDVLSTRRYSIPFTMSSRLSDIPSEGIDDCSSGPSSASSNRLSQSADAMNPTPPRSESVHPSDIHHIAPSEHVTTRAELVAAFETLVTMEEQLYYAILDLVCAMEKWREFAETAAPGSMLHPLWAAMDADECREQVEHQASDLYARLLDEWLPVLSAAEYFADFLAFLEQHEKDGTCPQNWDAYDLFPNLHRASGVPPPPVPDGFPFVWAFQLTHILSNCFQMNDVWFSLWHYRPCGDPCRAISKALSDTYAFVEDALTVAMVPMRKWGEFHRAYRRRPTKRRTSKTAIKTFRDMLAKGRTLFPVENRDTRYLHLLMDCFQQCLAVRQGTWHERFRGIYGCEPGRSPTELETNDTRTLTPLFAHDASTDLTHNASTDLCHVDVTDRMTHSSPSLDAFPSESCRMPSPSTRSPSPDMMPEFDVRPESRYTSRSASASLAHESRWDLPRPVHVREDSMGSQEIMVS